MTAIDQLLPLAILADDLTGALDSGLQLARRGLETVVQLDTEANESAPVVVLSSESRDASPSAAIASVGELIPRLRNRRVLKKIDSTFRGNVGYELRTLLSGLSLRAAVVAPSFPQGGRTLVNGRLLIDDQPLSMTPFRYDPRWPMLEAHLPTYLMQQSGMEVAHMGLDVVRRGVRHLARELAMADSRLVVVDAASDGDLATIAQATISLGPAWMPCGSAGLAQTWAALLDARASVPVVFPNRANRGMLFVAGSRNPVSLEQVESLVRFGVQQVTLDSRGVYEPVRETDRLTQAALEVLNTGDDLVIEATSSPAVPGAGPRVSQILAGAVRSLVVRDQVAGLFLTGGEVAIAVCRALEVASLRIVDEIEPGIPGAQLRGGQAAGLPAVTKAGGFGSPGAMIAARQWLHDKTHD